MESLNGKLAIVTGGTRGIGRAITESLLREGASVAITGRTQQSVNAALSQIKPLGNVIGQAVELTKYDEVRRFFDFVDGEFKALDILVNNAGAATFRKVGEMSPEDWHHNIDLDLNGPFYCSREALARFKTRGAGFIVNISSLAGKNAFAGGAGYNAAKAGLNLFTEAMMLDHRKDNVRVCSIMPGSVDTDFSGHPGKRSGDTSWMISPQDVADATIFTLRMPARTMVSRIEIRPSRPQT
ncbi:MAG TPA: SDR family oxidoreductase [Bryobacteraceae bacterium]|jgi:NAD(P)-dependent dehydrogenase (short-subunit alcohol dehydrogenase family)|nr:SDR family oxidoreductase [Bryobacteraceae bacterium]